MFGEDVKESEIVFRNTESPTDHPSPVPRSPPGSQSGSADLQYEDVLDMVQRLHKELGLIALDNYKIRTVCNQLLKDNQARDTFLHGVRVVGPERPATSTPYQPVREHAACAMSTLRQPLGRPVCLGVPDAPLHRQEGRQNYRPAAPIQRFNNKSLNWPAWFRHFRAVADVHETRTR